MRHVRTEYLTWSFADWVRDVGILVKWRLTAFVVFSSVMAYAIAAGTLIEAKAMAMLALGGFLVAGAANAMNEILERDFDKLMERTAHRPVASNRMSVSEAVIVAGFMLLAGVVLLALFNPMTAFLGMLSFILYAFIYTPLKRYGTIAVAVGAVPGALPALIGCVAFEGTVTWLAIMLFAIQFLWQFPHFWSIGWLSFDQYRGAGFKLLPSASDDRIDPSLGLHALLYCSLLVPASAGVYVLGLAGPVSTILLLATSLWFTYQAFNFYRRFDKGSARRLMFSSFAYLPLALMIILLGGMV